MPKVNAQVTDDIRTTLRRVAADNKTTMQAVVELAIALGVKSMGVLGSSYVARRLKPDGRKSNGTR